MSQQTKNQLTTEPGPVIPWLAIKLPLTITVPLLIKSPNIRY